MINIISIVSAAAIGIGCMALIIILSVYNGFDKIVESAYNSYIPDYVIEPAKGKTIDMSKNSRIITALFDLSMKAAVSGEAEHVQAFHVLEETVYVQYDAVQSIARIKGVDSAYFSLKRFEDNLVEGELSVMFGEVPRAVVEESLAASLLLSRPLIALFIQHGSDSVTYGARFLRILCLGGPFSACAYAIISFFQAVGESRKSFVLAVLRKGLLDIPMMFMLLRAIPVYGIVWATPIADLLCCVTALMLFTVFAANLSDRPGYELALAPARK